MKTFGSSSTCPRFLVSLFVLLVGCKSSPPSDPVDNPPTASISSPSADEVLRGTDTIFVNASDDFAVSKVELYLNGSLSNTDNAAPWGFIWDTETVSDGSYTLLVKAYDSRGQSGTSSSVSVTVKNAFPLTFHNTIYTPITVNVPTFSAQIIQSSDSVTFMFAKNPGTFTFTASTSGKTTGGTQIGLLISWSTSSPVDVSTVDSYHANLQFSSTYFFMYMKNTGKTTLGPVVVNYGLTDQRTENISVPGDGLTYPIGYYKAYSNTVIRAYWAYPYATSYSYWQHGSQFTFPNTTNQALTCSNSLPLTKSITTIIGEIVDSPGSITKEPVDTQKPSRNEVVFLAHD